MAEKKLKSWKEIPIGGLIDEPASALKFKTGDWRTFRPKMIWEKCTHCMICPPYCPDYCIPTKTDEKGNIKRLETNFDYCKGCGICAEVCPFKAIVMEGESKFIK